MKYKTSELTGWRLDQAAAKAGGYRYDVARSYMVVLDLATNISKNEEGCTVIRGGGLMHYSPSTKWEHGGEIIDREKIGLQYLGAERGWLAGHCYPPGPGVADGRGETPLIAAMRCFVAGKCGAEVDL